jgi:dihydrofolate synthase / folylpolyglutamate synthase
MSFYHFANINQVDIVLYEVGLGGRFDSTNIINPIASIITNIGLDHTNILGHTYEEIAFEKAGIIKEGTPIFTAVKNASALKVIEQQAEMKHAPLYRLNQEFSVTSHSPLATGEVFTLKNKQITWEQLEISMIGQHQTENAALAVMAARSINHEDDFSISESAIRTGLKKAYWPGRFEILSKNPLVIMDGAHNDEGIAALVHELSNRYSMSNIHIVFAALKDKKLDQMIAQLDNIADKISFVTFDFPRAAEAIDLYSISKSNNKVIVENWESYLGNIIQKMNRNQVLVVTGSLYFISEAKPYLCEFLKNNKISL